MGCVMSLLEKDPDLQETYHLDKLLGEGVEGEVWLARLKATGAVTAIKLIPRDDDLGLGPEKVKREIQLQARLSHVNIVELKQVILTPRHLGIVMSYEAGGDLHNFCTKFKIDEVAARYFFRQIISALDYCHHHRIAHRDLKLSNFLLTGQDPPRLKLTDFGCAGHWQKKAPPNKLGRMRTFAGTPAYMAPQVLESAFYPTHTYSAVEADVWACGILLCHMFFGHHTPFWLEPNAYRNEGATALERIRAMKGGPGGWLHSDPFIEKHAAGLSRELRDLLDRIFVGEEDKRITIQGIKEHDWFNGHLYPNLQAAIDDMAEEQRTREKLARAAVSTAAGQHELMDQLTGSYATINTMVDMAAAGRKVPGGGRMLVLDMVHMDVDPFATSSVATSTCATPTGASSAADCDAAWAAAAAGGPQRQGSGSLGAGDASAHGARAGGDKSAHGGRAGLAGDERTMGRQLSLKHHASGLVTAEYTLDQGTAAGRGSPLVRAGEPGLFATEAERSAHGGTELFRAASAAKAARGDRSWHAGVAYNAVGGGGGGGDKSVGRSTQAAGGAAPLTSLREDH